MHSQVTENEKENDVDEKDRMQINGSPPPGMYPPRAKTKRLQNPSPAKRLKFNVEVGSSVIDDNYRVSDLAKPVEWVSGIKN